MRVRAKTMIFIGGARRREGEVFEVPAGTKNKHLEPVDPPVQRVSRKVKEEPVVLPEPSSEE